MSRAQSAGMQTSVSMSGERAHGAYGGNDGERDGRTDGAEATPRLAAIARELASTLVSMSGHVARLRRRSLEGSPGPEARAMEDALTEAVALVRALGAEPEPQRRTVGPGAVADAAVDDRGAHAICIELRGAAVAGRVAFAVKGLATLLGGSVEIGVRGRGRASIVIHVPDAC
jgi:hypothetical protein